jgi:hypothetical protein
MRNKFPRANDRTLTCRYVVLWHETDMPTGRDDVRFRGKAGSHVQTVNVTANGQANLDLLSVAQIGVLSERRMATGY